MAPAKQTFDCEILEFSEVHTLPGSWSAERYRGLLEHFDYDDIASIADGDLADMTAMVAQDLGLRPAADHALAFVIGDAMSPGVRQNLIDDLTGERPWEQFTKLSQQAGIFEVVEFLQLAFPNQFGIPDAARVRVRISPKSETSSAWLRTGLEASLLLRLLADAMDERATLRRLYAEPLESGPFPDAEAILWSVSKVEDHLSETPAWCVLEVISSLQWFEALREADGVQPSDAWPDD